MKKSAIKLTDTHILGLKKRSANYCVWDNACPGFGVEVTPAGTKLMVAKTCQDGRRAWHTLGTFGVSGEEWTDPTTGQVKRRKWNTEDFRLRAQLLKDQVRRGEDPKAVIEAKKAAAMARRQRFTISQLADRFIKDHIRAEVTREENRLVIVKIGPEGSGNRLSTAKEHVRLIEKFIRPTLGALPVEDVGTAEIAGMLRKIQDETPIQANRVRSVLSKMFVRAEIWGYRPVGSNPVRGQDREPEHKRERNLTDKEIQALGKALRDFENPLESAEALPPHPIAAIRLALLTGMRKGEILALRWEWVDLKDKEIRIPADSHKTGAKTRKERVVLLCEAACELLKSLCRNLGNPFVIAGRGQAALVNLQDPWEDVRLAADLDYKKAWIKAHQKEWDRASDAQKVEIEKKIDEKQVHFHDLRRTFASVAARMAYPEIWIGALLGHSAGTVTAGYARADMRDDPLRNALEAVGARIWGLLDGSIDLDKEAKAGKTAAKVRV